MTTLLFAAAALLLLLDLALSAALVASSTLSHIRLRRMASEDAQRWSFLEGLDEPESADRTAVEIARQFTLGLFLFAVAVAAHREIGEWGAVVAITFATLAATVIVENVAARILGLWNPRAVLRFTAPLLRVLRLVLSPVVVPLRLLLQRVQNGRRMSSEEREEEREEDVEALIEVGEREGLLEAEEGEMMRGIVDLDETAVRELMTPRMDIVALTAETSVAEARRTFLEAGHSRLPVFGGSIDNVVGVLHSRDLFQAWEAARETESIAPYVREATFVAETLSAADVLALIRQKTHLAVVVDEYGGVAGLVTLEDLLEEIVGDIRDEHESEEEPLRRDLDGSWIVHATTRVEELEELLSLDLGPREFDTVGGLVVADLGRVPVVGEVLSARGLRLEVLRADRRRVHKVRVQPESGRLSDASVEDAR